MVNNAVKGKLLNLSSGELSSAVGVMNKGGNYNKIERVFRKANDYY